MSSILTSTMCGTSHLPLNSHALCVCQIYTKSLPSGTISPAISLEIVEVWYKRSILAAAVVTLSNMFYNPPFVRQCAVVILPSICCNIAIAIPSKIKPPPPSPLFQSSTLSIPHRQKPPLRRRRKPVKALRVHPGRILNRLPGSLRLPALIRTNSLICIVINFMVVILRKSTIKCWCIRMRPFIDTSQIGSTVRSWRPVVHGRTRAVVAVTKSE